jgi:CRP-like cAMP-binding protein
MSKETEELKKVPLFGNFSDAMLGEFAASFRRSSYKAGDIIFEEKSAGDTLFILISGQVVIEKGMDETGETFKQLAILSDGEFFGEMAVLEDQNRFARARAGKDSSLYEIKRSELFGFVKEHPENGIAVFTEIVRVLSKRLQHTSSELTMLFDMSRLVLQDHKSAAEFIERTVKEIGIYFEGSWNFYGYAYNQFNDEFDAVAVKESFGQDPSVREIKGELVNGWKGESGYLMVCRAHGKPAGYVLFLKSSGVSHYEKNNLSTIFNTISSIMGSAIENIEHRTEAALLEKLKTQRYTI